MEIKQQDILNTIKNIEGIEGKSISSADSNNVPPVICETLQKSDESASGISVKAVIGYESLTGNVKNRNFLIRRIIKNKGDYFIDGLALDINAPRLIRVSKISYIIDTVSEHTYSNPYKFIQNILGVDIEDKYLPEPMSDFAKAIKETGNEITVLMYLVAIDGTRCSEERKHVLKYIQQRVPYLNYDEEQMNNYLISLAPDDDSFSMAFHRVLKKGKFVIQPLLETVLKVIMADGIVHTKEKAFLARLIDILHQDGYEIDLPLQN